MSFKLLFVPYMRFYGNKLMKDKYKSCAYKVLVGVIILNLISYVDDILNNQNIFLIHVRHD
jgi:hypothetical protein